MSYVSFEGLRETKIEIFFHFVTFTQLVNLIKTNLVYGEHQSYVY